MKEYPFGSNDMETVSAPVMQMVWFSFCVDGFGARVTQRSVRCNQLLTRQELHRKRWEVFAGTSVSPCSLFVKFRILVVFYIW